MNISFKKINNENDVMYHCAYILLCNIFPNMMPYWAFKNYILTIAYDETNMAVQTSDVLQTVNKCIGFMLLDTNNLTNNTTNNSINNSSDSNVFDMLDTSSDSSEMSDALEISKSDQSDKELDKDSDKDSNKEQHNKKITTIVSLGIHPNYRKKGIADAYIKWVKKMYPSEIFDLHVSVKNSDAIKLYENNNFKSVKIEIKYYTDMSFEPYTGKGTDAHYMVCCDAQNYL